MEQKCEFRTITKDIKRACLLYGCGTIQLDQHADEIWLDDNENELLLPFHVTSITIDLDNIILEEDANSRLTFDQVISIDRQIQIYETIFAERAQLRIYELDWDVPFEASRVENEDGSHYYWRVLSADEARHLFHNGACSLFRLYPDGTEAQIESKEELEESIEEGYLIGCELE